MNNAALSLNVKDAPALSNSVAVRFGALEKSSLSLAGPETLGLLRTNSTITSSPALIWLGSL